MSRGGGSSGKVGYPAYMETQHETWLDSVALLVTADAAGASPYNTAFAYDPDYDLNNFQVAVDEFGDRIEDIEPEANFEEFLIAAANAVDDNMLSDSYIADLANTYEETQLPSYFRSINRFTGPMSDLNAVHTSAFVIGLAIMEQDFQNNISAFTANMKMQRDRLRTVAVLDAVKGIMQLFSTEVQGDMSRAQLQADFAYKAVLFKTNQYEQDLAISVKDIMWDYDLFMRGGEMLGAISGAASGPTSTPRAASALSGALSGGANAAMTFGQIGGAEGALLGLVLGGGMGGLGGFLGA